MIILIIIITINDSLQLVDVNSVKQTHKIIIKKKLFQHAVNDYYDSYEQYQ